jgi:Lrp/AsnC family leucine-responsive transcriptional regulator
MQSKAYFFSFIHNSCMNTAQDDDLLLDRYDLRLLAALQLNTHATHQALGEMVHLSASQVSRRIQRLQSCGLIQAHVALLHAGLLGLDVVAISYITMTRHGGSEGRDFEAAIADFPEVLECFAVTGESDYILKLIAADLQELSDSVLQRLARLPGVANIRSNIVLKPIKSTTALPLSHLERLRRTRPPARLQDHQRKPY